MVSPILLQRLGSPSRFHRPIGEQVAFVYRAVTKTWNLSRSIFAVQHMRVVLTLSEAGSTRKARCCNAPAAIEQRAPSSGFPFRSRLHLSSAGSPDFSLDTDASTLMRSRDPVLPTRHHFPADGPMRSALKILHCHYFPAPAPRRSTLWTGRIFPHFELDAARLQTPGSPTSLVLNTDALSRQ